VRDLRRSAIQRSQKMKDYLTKLCMFLFLAALFSGRTNELGVLTGALTGTVLLWPLYRKFVPAPKRRRIVVVDEDVEIAEATAPELAAK
jgi:hypothetical protein